MSDIEYLDFAAETHQFGLRERALAAHEQRRVGVLCEAREHIQEVLDVQDPVFTQVEVKNGDGDGEAFCDVDEIPLKVTVTYPSGGGDTARTLKLFVKAGFNWTEIRNLAELGRLLTPDPPAS